jgi:hypothetical protein
MSFHVRQSGIKQSSFSISHRQIIGRERVPNNANQFQRSAGLRLVTLARSNSSIMVEKDNGKIKFRPTYSLISSMADVAREDFVLVVMLHRPESTQPRQTPPCEMRRHTSAS